MNTILQWQDQVQRAISDAKPLCIVGGGSKCNLGREQVGDPIEVIGHAGIVEYQPTELMITVRAGTKLSYLQAILAEERQMLASGSPEYDGIATIGGALACNDSGPSRPWSGSIRDHVLGIRLINGKAEHLRFGGQVMKNVAGYDVARLQAGAMGTLGLITEISLKTLPGRESSISLKRELGANDAIHAMNEICKTPTPLAGACWYNGFMYIRLSGSETVVEAAASGIEGERLADDDVFWTALREQALPFFGSAQDLWRFSVRANSEHVEPQADWLIDWGGARRWLAGQHDVEDLECIASDLGGEVSRYRGGDRSAEVSPTLSETKRELLMRLKQAFDPAGIFNPGRVYSWM